MRTSDLIKLAQDLVNKYGQDAGEQPLSTIEQAGLFSLLSHAQKVVDGLFRACGEPAPQLGADLLVSLRSDHPTVSSKQAKAIAQLILNTASAFNSMQQSASGLLNK